MITIECFVMENNLNDMMIFKLVAEQSSFTKAAELVGLPKSNISRKVTRLEKSLGVRLLERTTRSLHLTQIGQVYLEHCQRIHEEVSSAQHCVAMLASIPQGGIKIAASISVGQHLIAPNLSEFYQQFPKIKLDLSLTNRRVDVINEGFDLAIRVGPSKDSTLISKRIGQVCLGLYASKNYLSEQNSIKTPSQLIAQQCLYMNAVDEKQIWSLHNCDEKVQVELAPIMTSDDFNVLLQATIDNMGITLLPHYMATQYVNSEQLIPVLPDWQSGYVNIYAIYPSRMGVTPKLNALLDFLTQRILAG